LPQVGVPAPSGVTPPVKTSPGRFWRFGRAAIGSPAKQAAPQLCHTLGIVILADRAVRRRPLP